MASGHTRGGGLTYRWDDLAVCHLVRVGVALWLSTIPRPADSSLHTHTLRLLNRFGGTQQSLAPGSHCRGNRGTSAVHMFAVDGAGHFSAFNGEIVYIFGGMKKGGSKCLRQRKGARGKAGKENLKVDQVARALDDGTPVIKLRSRLASGGLRPSL
jgi:hypothetical protein